MVNIFHPFTIMLTAAHKTATSFSYFWCLLYHTTLWSCSQYWFPIFQSIIVAQSYFSHSDYVFAVRAVKKETYGMKKEVIVIIDYSPLWETMREKNISQYKLLQNGIDNKTLDTLKKKNNVTLLTVEKLCNILDCTPNDIVRFKKEDFWSLRAPEVPFLSLLFLL